MVSSKYNKKVKFKSLYLMTHLWFKIKFNSLVNYKQNYHSKIISNLQNLGKKILSTILKTSLLAKNLMKSQQDKKRRAKNKAIS